MNEPAPPVEAPAVAIESHRSLPGVNFAKAAASVAVASALLQIQQENHLSEPEMLHIVSLWQTQLLRRLTERENR